MKLFLLYWVNLTLKLWVKFFDRSIHIFQLFRGLDWQHLNIVCAIYISQDVRIITVRVKLILEKFSLKNVNWELIFVWCEFDVSERLFECRKYNLFKFSFVIPGSVNHVTFELRRHWNLLTFTFCEKILSMDRLSKTLDYVLDCKMFKIFTFLNILCFVHFMFTPFCYVYSVSKVWIMISESDLRKCFLIEQFF